MRLFNLIYARTEQGGIGKDNKIPWYDKDDMKHFKNMTTNHIVIMGTNTKKSLPRGELPDRKNIVISKYNTLEFVLQSLCNKEDKNKEIFIIGGGELYNYCIRNYLNLIKKIYATIIKDNIYECDVLIDVIDNMFGANIENIYTTEKGNSINKIILPNFDENKYLGLIKEILNEGNKKDDRTKTGTLSVFSRTLSFDLRDNKLPLITTKRVSFKMILVELLWFIKGSCCSDYLKENNCHIWDANIKDKGQLGPLYPFQWRRRGAKYIHDNVDTTENSIDQLANMIKLIKEDPNSRRILIDNWDVINLNEMCLSPCHVLFQVYVKDNIFLEGMVYLRSSDVILGLPYNIASYSILLHLLARLTNKKASKITIITGDTHIYNNHIKAAEEQKERVPFTFPTLHISLGVKDIDNLKIEDFNLFDYEHRGELTEPTPMAH